MTAEGCSSAELDGAMTRRWAVDNEAPMPFPIGFTVPTEHVSDFQLGAIHGAGLGLRGPGRGSLTGVWKQVERNGSAAYLAGCNSQVPGGGRQAAMAEQQLNGADISALLQQVHSKATPQGMRRDGFANAALPVSLLEGLPDSLPADVATSDIARKQPLFGPCKSPPVPQDFQEFRGEHDIAILLTLALFDPNHHSLTINMGRFQSDGFGDSQALRNSWLGLFDA